MPIFTATILSENEVAEHNAPTVLAAHTEEALEDRVRAHIKDCWASEMGLDDAEVDSMDISSLNEKFQELVDEGAEFGDVCIHTAQHPD